MATHTGVLTVIKLLFAGLGLVAILYFVLIPLVKMLRAKPDIDLIIPDYTQLDEEEEELQIPTSQQKPDRNALLDMARRDPRATAMLISRWIRSRN